MGNIHVVFAKALIWNSGVWCTHLSLSSSSRVVRQLLLWIKSLWLVSCSSSLWRASLWERDTSRSCSCIRSDERFWASTKWLSWRDEGKTTQGCKEDDVGVSSPDLQEQCRANLTFEWPNHGITISRFVTWFYVAQKGLFPIDLMLAHFTQFDPFG